MRNQFISAIIVCAHGGLTGILVAYAALNDFRSIAVGLLALGALFIVGRNYARKETIDLVKESGNG